MAWIRRGVVLGMGWVTDFNTGGLNSGSPFDRNEEYFYERKQRSNFQKEQVSRRRRLSLPLAVVVAHRAHRSLEVGGRLLLDLQV